MERLALVPRKTLEIHRRRPCDCEQKRDFHIRIATFSTIRCLGWVQVGSKGGRVAKALRSGLRLSD